MFIWFRVGAVDAPNMRAAYPLFHVIQKIRPTDQERDETQFSVVQEGDRVSYKWALPNGNLEYGARDIEFDTDEAEALVSVLETQQAPVKIADMEWLDPMIRRLKKEEVLAA